MEQIPAASHCVSVNLQQTIVVVSLCYANSFVAALKSV